MIAQLSGQNILTKYLKSSNSGRKSMRRKRLRRSLLRDIQDGIFELTESKRKDRIRKISDEDLPEVARYMKAITEILKKYKE